MPPGVTLTRPFTRRRAESAGVCATTACTTRWGETARNANRSSSKTPKRTSETPSSASVSPTDIVQSVLEMLNFRPISLFGFF